MNMDKVLSFGEILIRLQSEQTVFFDKGKNTLKIFAGGSEANVAVALAEMGIPAKFVTAIPKDNPLAAQALQEIEKHKVDTSHTLLRGDRIGTYYLQSKNGLTKGEVIYDRAFSSFSKLTAADIDRDRLFDNVRWFHWTALTPGLNPEMVLLIQELIKEAKRRDIPISVDLNYRSKLWKYGKKPHEILPQLVQDCDVIMGNIWASHTFLQSPISSGLTRDTSKETYFEKAGQTAKYIFENYPKCKHIANTFRFMDNESHNLLYGTYHTRTGDYISKVHETHKLIDRIGSGDAFMAGLIQAILKGKDEQTIVEEATQSGFDKLFIEGDFGVTNK